MSTIFEPSEPVRQKYETSFFVTGEPKGQPRPRAFARRMGNKFVARVYDAGTAEGWKGCIATTIKAEGKLPAQPLSNPVSLKLVFWMPRPKAHFRSNGDLKPGIPSHFTKKPDADNLAKAVMDALTQLGFWTDDDLIYELIVEKKYVPKDHRPGALITIKEVA